MADKDIITKEYMSKNEIFADVFNFYLYNGKQVINPNELKELDTNEKVVINNDFGTLISQKFRDLLKSCIIKTDDKQSYVILGIENQTLIDKGMVVRVMLYDALQYHAQYKQKGVITPVVTLVVSWDNKEWKAPKSLYEMFDLKSKDYPEDLNQIIKDCISDFKINVLDPHNIDDSEISKFVSEYYNVCWFIKHQNNISDTDINSDEFKRRFSDVSKDTVLVINTMTDANINNEKERVNMCRALEVMKKQSYDSGYDSGYGSGYSSGLKSEELKIVKRMLSCGYKWDTITQLTDMTEEEYNTLIDSEESDSNPSK